MAAIDWADVTAFVSGLSAVNSDAQDDILAHVNVILKVSEYDDEEGVKTRLARIYLAAHMGTMGLIGSSGSVGPIKKERAGNLEREYDSGSSSSTATTYGDYGDTAYGRMFMAMTRTNPGRAPFVI